MLCLFEFDGDMRLQNKMGEVICIQRDGTRITKPTSLILVNSDIDEIHSCSCYYSALMTSLNIMISLFPFHMERSHRYLSGSKICQVILLIQTVCQCDAFLCHTRFLHLMSLD